MGCLKAKFRKGIYDVDMFMMVRDFHRDVAMRKVKKAVGTDTAVSWWTLLCGRAKYSVTFGEFETDLESWALDRDDPIPNIVPHEEERIEHERKVWTAFVEAGLVEVDGDLGDWFVARIPNLGDYQHEKRAPAKSTERVRRHRAKTKDETNETRYGNAHETRDETRGNGETPYSTEQDSLSSDGTSQSPDRTPRTPGEAISSGGTVNSKIGDAEAHEIEQLLAKLTDADAGTEGVLRSLFALGANWGDYAAARDKIDTPGVRSSSAVAVDEIKRRVAERSRAAAELSRSRFIRGTGYGGEVDRNGDLIGGAA